jgi:teichuronic acid biosynthesis glycosyltransferase TuaG
MATQGLNAVLGSSPGPDAGNDLVSVVIPSYNSATFIRATLESVMAQTYANLEVIVVDDCSPDATAAMVAEIALRDRRIRLLQLASNHEAPAHPRNVGVRAASGAWIAFLDADDLWHPQKLEHQMRAIADTGVRMCSTQMQDFRSQDEVKPARPAVVARQRINLHMQLVKYRTPASSVVVERQWMLDHPFNEDLRFKAREDVDCFIRIHEYLDYSLKLQFPFVFYRLQQGQISGNKLRMVARHFYMLRQYRFRSGKRLGLRAGFYTFTHFALSLYIRRVLGRL